MNKMKYIGLFQSITVPEGRFVIYMKLVERIKSVSTRQRTMCSRWKNEAKSQSIRGQHE